MTSSGTSAGRGWLHCALNAAAVAGGLALLDGWLQGGNPLPMLRVPVMAYSVIGNWGIAGVVLLLAWPVLRKDPPRPSTGMAIGAFAGCAPLLFGLIPGAFESFRIALAHMGSVAVALLVFALARPGLSLRAASLLAAAPAGVLAAALLLPNELPALRSAEAAADDRRLAEIGGRPLAPPGAPNLVLISVDTLRADALVPDENRPGVPAAPAPFLQSLREGAALWAPYALSSSDQTLPGHVGMLAGMDAMAHGVRSNSETPAGDLRFLAQILRAGGYRTSATIANGLIGATTAMDRGYDSFSEQPVELALFGLNFSPWLDAHTWIGRCSPARRNAQLFAQLFYRRAWSRRALPIGERTLRAAQEQAEEPAPDDAPQFRFVHFMDPHTDYEPPSPWRGRLSQAAADGVAAEYLPASGAVLSAALAERVERDLGGAAADAARRAAAYYHLVYLEEVMYTDDCLRRLTASLSANGRPTVFLLTADHGEMFGEHGLMEHANGLWEENLRVPFLLWGANVPAGRLPWVPQLADVAPTLLTLAGLAVPPEMTGQSVVLPADGSRPDGSRAPAALRVPAAAERDHVAAEATEVSVRRGAWKWTGVWDAAAPPAAPLRIIDLEGDPFEQNPLPELPALLREALAAVLPRDTWPQRKRVELGGAHAGLLQQLSYVGN